MAGGSTKKCTKCNKRKRLLNFHRKGDGHHSHCKQCRATSSKQYRKRSRTTDAGRSVELWQEGRKRARLKGIEWRLTKKWVAKRVGRGLCADTGLPFDLSNVATGSRNPRAPSIHRINSSKGYTPRNCRVVIYQLNAALNEWPEQLFEQMAAAYLDRRLQ